MQFKTGLEVKTSSYLNLLLVFFCFQDNQRDLESATEQLSEYLERDIDDENLFDIKLKVLDKYKYCDSRRKILLAYVHEGYEKDWWEYTEEI